MLCLTDEQKQNQINVYHEFQKTLQRDLHFLSYSVTGDKTGAYRYNIKTKKEPFTLDESSITARQIHFNI
jgi:hypothetical protein